MSDTALFWLLLTLACIAIQGIFSMLEMAYVSFNRVKLHYYVSQKKQRALWVHKLLQDPAKLFGTTLVGVNIALQVGSECSRQFYEALNINADIAPLTQGFLVLIFAELSPMFAARKYAEYVALLGAPFLYVVSLILTPVNWLIRFLNYLANKLFRGNTPANHIFLTREELQKAFEFHDSADLSPSYQFSDLIANVFDIKNWTAQDIMTPIHLVPKISSHTTIEQMRLRLKKYPAEFLPIFFQSHHHIVGIAFTKDMVHIKNSTHRVRDYSRPPWFILQGTTVLQILQQFKKNNQDVAIILNSGGKAVGILSLDDILEKMFHSPRAKVTRKSPYRKPFIQKSFSAETKVSKINRRYGAQLEASEEETLAQFIIKQLGHKPEKGDSIKVDRLEITVTETSLLGIKKVNIRSLI